MDNFSFFPEQVQQQASISNPQPDISAQKSPIRHISKSMQSVKLSESLKNENKSIKQTSEK